MRSLWETPELCDGSDAVGQLANEYLNHRIV